MLSAYEALSSAASAPQPTLLAHKTSPAAGSTPDAHSSVARGGAQGQRQIPREGSGGDRADTVRRKEAAEMEVVAKQQAARRRAREEAIVDRWRRQQMDSWHEQQESRRASEEAKANLRAARQIKEREALKTERSQIRLWAAEQSHAWRAVEEAEEDGKKALRRAAMEQQGKLAERKTLMRWFDPPRL